MNRKELDLNNTSSLNRYISHCKSISMNKKSFVNRVSAIKKFILFILEKGKKIEEVYHFDIDEFLENELNNETSASTVNNYYSYLKGFFHFLKEKGDNTVLDFNKVIFEKTINKYYDTFNEQEIIEVFNIISKQRNKIVKLRDIIMFKLLLFTGCTLSELNSINVYLSQSYFNDDDYFILLREKEMYFRRDSLIKFKLPESIIQDIFNYYSLVEKSLGIKLQDRRYLFLSWYGKKVNGEKRIEITRLKNNSLQTRMATIKKSSSFSNRKLSIKNIRHSLISNLINMNIRLDIVSVIVGLDISSLKFYLSDSNSFDNELSKIMTDEHPFNKFL